MVERKSTTSQEDTNKGRPFVADQGADKKPEVTEAPNVDPAVDLSGDSDTPIPAGFGDVGNQTEEEAVESAKKNAEAERARAEAQLSGSAPAGTRGKKGGPFDGLVDNDLTDQKTGHAKPISATTQSLQATIVNANGRVLLKIGLRGYIGEEPIVLNTADAGEFAELISALEKAVGEQKKQNAKDAKS